MCFGRGGLQYRPLHVRVPRHIPAVSSANSKTGCSDTITVEKSPLMPTFCQPANLDSGKNRLCLLRQNYCFSGFSEVFGPFARPAVFANGVKTSFVNLLSAGESLTFRRVGTLHKMRNHSRLILLWHRNVSLRIAARLPPLRLQTMRVIGRILGSGRSCPIDVTNGGHFRTKVRMLRLRVK